MQHLIQQQIEAILGYRFDDKALLAQAFIHRSYYNENKEVEYNERLEFLGDSVLTLLISDYLFHHLPLQAEGVLSQLRSRIVDAPTCAKLIQKYGLGQYVQLGKGEQNNGGRGRDSILADLFEALLGAIYLDGGIIETHRVFWNLFEKDVLLILQEPMRNWKAELQDYSQKKIQTPPQYRVDEAIGPDHSKKFYVVVSLAGVDMGRGEGLSKKQAEQAAAQDAIQRIEYGKK